MAAPSFQISGSAVAVNARLRLRPVLHQQGVAAQRTYSDASGNYLFTSVPAGTYQLIADLTECTTAPYNTGYSYRTTVVVTMDAVGDNLIDVNFAPTLNNAANQVATPDN